MNHTILLENLERLHEHVCKLEQRFEATHLGVHNQNANPTHHGHQTHYPGNPTNGDDNIYANPPMLAEHHVHDAVSLADRIIRTVESWAYGRTPSTLGGLPTEQQLHRLENLISRYKTYAAFSDLITALTPRLASITPSIRHFESPMWRAIHAGYFH